MSTRYFKGLGLHADMQWKVEYGTSFLLLPSGRWVPAILTLDQLTTYPDITETDEHGEPLKDS